jgi:hypothetical protein
MLVTIFLLMCLCIILVIEFLTTHSTSTLTFLSTYVLMFILRTL